MITLLAIHETFLKMIIQPKQILALAGIFLFISCSKDTTNDTTTNGSNTSNNLAVSHITCKVNGKDWGDCKKGWAPSSNYEGQHFLGNYIDFEGTESCEIYDKGNTNLYIRLNISDTGYYPIKDHRAVFIRYTDQYPYTEIFEADSLSEGFVRVTRFEQQQSLRTLVDGYFEFTVFNNDRSESMTISNGQFSDVKLGHY